MTITASSSDFFSQFTSSSSTPTIVLPNDVVAGETIVLGIRLLSKTQTVSSVSDPVNGTWSGGDVGSTGPNDNPGSSAQRTYFYYHNNSAALTGASNRTITATLSGAVNASLGAGVIADSGGALSFDEFATTTFVNPAGTNHDTNSVTADGAGAIIGFHTPDNASNDPSADGTGESRLYYSSGDRVDWFFEQYGSSGSKNLEITGLSDVVNVEVAAFLEPAAAGITIIVPTGPWY